MTARIFSSILILVLAAVAAVVLIRLIESRSIFFPMKGIPNVIQNAPAHEDVFFQSTDGKRLNGWLIAASDPSAPVVLFLHGNAGNIGHRWEKIRILHGLGVSVFIFDYRGYGLSQGRPSEAGLYKDTDAAYAYLTGRGIPPEKIIVYGESIGGAFAVDLVMRKTLKSLIIEDTFTSIPAMVRRSMPFIPKVALATRLDSLGKIGRVHVPKLIFHSIDDEIVPFDMGQALFDAAVEPKRFVRLHGGHNTAFLEDIETYRAELHQFLTV